MRAYQDLRRANTVGGFDGMASTIYEHEVMDDPGKAFVDMDGMTEGQNDGARYQLRGTPLPITHASFWMSKRQLAVSRSRGQALDFTRAQFSAQRVGEEIERMTIGTSAGMTYGNDSAYDRKSQIFGMLNHPSRLTKTDLTVPDGTNGDTVLAEVLEVRDQLYQDHQYGPFVLYTATDWDRWLDTDFKTGVTGTLRQRLLAVDGISSIRRLDFLDPTLANVNPYTWILLDLNTPNHGAINGLELRTLQWPSHGGERINFKVMAIQIPLFRDDFYGHMGLAVANAP
jgi:hypothetical protein